MRRWIRFFEVNGYCLTLSDNEAYDLVMQVAQGQIDKPVLSSSIAAAIQSLP